MKLFLLFLTALTVVFGSHAQSVKGVLVDSDGKPEEYANVLLFLASDSSLKATALSDSTGAFDILLPDVQQAYYIEVKNIGASGFISQPFVGEKDLGRITLANTEVKLDEVEIRVKKPFIEKTARGLVMNISESPVLQGGNSKDVLEKIPGAVLNQDGSVTLKGKQNVLIYMDGKPTNMSMADLVRLLETTPASEIEKVEVFETPPAKFDAAGNAGIINFQTKKGKKLGYNGSAGLSAGYGNFHKLNPWLSSNYRTKRINVFGSAWYYNNKFDHRSTTDMMLVNEGQSSSFYNKFHRIHHPEGVGGRAGIDFFVRDNLTIGYLSNWYNGAMDGKEPSSVEVTGPARSIYDYLDAMQRFNYYWSGHTHNLNLKKQIGKEESINIDVDYANRINGNQSSNLNEYFIGDVKLNQNYILQKGNAQNHIFLGKVDYEKTIFKDVSMDVGAKSSYVTTLNDFRAYTGTSDNDLVENLNASNRFRYQEAIQAVYSTFSKKWKDRWSGDIGMRLEHTQANGVSITSTQSFTKSYTNLFPNVSLGYKVPDKYSFSGSFTRRIDRPNYYQLNPFQTQTNAFNFWQGNPNLNPQITHVANLTYGIKDKWFVTLSAANTQGLMNEVLIQEDQQQRQIHTTENLNHFYNYSLNVVAPFKLTSWWTTNWNLTGFYNEMSSNFNWGVVGYDILSFSVQMQQNFSLPNDYKLEVSGFYNHDSYWNIWFVKPHYQLDAGVNKQFKRFNVNISVKDFLNIREGIGGVFQGNIYMPTTYKPESRKVMVSITYKFGKQTVNEARRRSTGSEELQRRAGD